MTSSRDSAPAGPDEAFAAVGRALAEAVADAVGPWVTGAVGRVLGAWHAAGAGDAGGGAGAGDQGAAVPGDAPILDRAEAAGRQAADDLRAALEGLAALDVDAQRVTPLQLVREAVAYPTAVLAEAGVPPVARDDFAAERFPADLYDLAPSSLQALGPGVAELGLAWGAAKAAAHRARHQG